MYPIFASCDHTLFIYHPFATCIALGQVKQSIRQERNNDSQTFYKNYIISVNKSIRIDVQYKLGLSSSIVVYLVLHITNSSIA
jgi:hypothetical protein